MVGNGSHGLDPTSSAGPDGALGDPDGDGFTNLQEYSYGAPMTWDNAGTTTLLDNGVWWNGTVPVRLWNEEDAMQYAQPGCGDAGSDGSGSIILCDEDPVGNICTDGFDNDRDGSVDSADPDNDGDADCSSNDDDGDGVEDEDVDGWDTDGDGMPDGWEASYGLDPTSASSTDGANGDPDGDGLINLYEYANPSWTTTCNGQPCWRPGPPTVKAMTETTTPCNPSSLPPVGPGGCATLTAEVDGVTSTNPNVADTDGDGLNDSYEALILLTDPTAADTDNDGIDDGIEVGSAYGDPLSRAIRGTTTRTGMRWTTVRRTPMGMVCSTSVRRIRLDGRTAVISTVMGWRIGRRTSHARIGMLPTRTAVVSTMAMNGTPAMAPILAIRWRWSSSTSPHGTLVKRD